MINIILPKQDINENTIIISFQKILENVKADKHDQSEIPSLHIL